jgi:5'-nucleotidase
MRSRHCTALAALLLGALAIHGCASTAPSTPRVLHLVALNDFHGALYEEPVPGGKRPDEVAGGFVWLDAAVRALRAEHPDLLLVDGGDLFQGALEVNATSGMAGVEAFRRLGVVAAAVGNHEFDYGPGHAAQDRSPAADGASGALRGALLRAFAESSFQWLAANIEERCAEGHDCPGGTRPWLPPGLRRSALVEYDGVRVGLLGLSTVETPATTRSAYVDGLVFSDPVEAARVESAKLRGQGAEIVVALAHVTGSCAQPGPFEPAVPCRPDGELGRLLTELPPGALDVVVAGHTHRLMAFRYGDTYVLGAGAKGMALARLDLAVGPLGVDHTRSTLHPHWLLTHAAVEPGCSGGPFPLSPLAVGHQMLSPQADTAEWVASLRAQSGERCVRVGCTTEPLRRAWQSNSPLGSLAARAMHEAFGGAHVAVQNPGGVRADLPAGPIHKGDVHAVLPFDNALELVEITGRDLALLFRIGTSGAHGVLELSGAIVEIDPEAQSGSDLDGDGNTANWEVDRLCTATIGGAPLRPEATYRVVVTDFLRQGGDHLGPALRSATIVETRGAPRDALQRHLEGLGECASSAPFTEPAVRFRPGCKRSSPSP